MSIRAAAYQISSVLVVGIGGVGGYLGGLLARRYPPEEAAGSCPRSVKIVFAARGAHLQAIRENGLLLNTTERSGLVCRPAAATDAIEGLAVPDLCLVCVKGYDLEEVSRKLAGIVGERTIIVAPLNGVDIRQRIRRQVQKGIVLPACVYVSASIDRPGVVTQQGMAGVLICGKDPEHSGYEPAAAVELFRQAGISAKYQEDASPAIWEKYLFISSFALVTAWAERPFGAVLQDEELRGLVRKTMGEIAEIAARQGVKIAKGALDASLKKAENFPYETKTSYQRDVEKGSRNEGDLFGGTILRLGRRLGVPTPVTERLYAEIEGRLQSS